MRENKSLSAWRRGEQTIGCWLSLANSYSAEAISKLGFDWVCIDLQHGMIDYTDLAQMLPAISNSDATPLVRVPWNEPYEIMKVLDAGAYGVAKKLSRRWLRAAIRRMATARSGRSAQPCMPGGAMPRKRTTRSPASP